MLYCVPEYRAVWYCSKWHVSFTGSWTWEPDPGRLSVSPISKFKIKFKSLDHGSESKNQKFQVGNDIYFRSIIWNTRTLKKLVIINGLTPVLQVTESHPKPWDCHILTCILYLSFSHFMSSRASLYITLVKSSGLLGLALRRRSSDTGLYEDVSS